MTKIEHRSRWAAIGAAVAVTLGAGGGFGLANAVQDSGERSTYVPISPCRLIDTRASNQVGPRSSALGPNETYTIEARGQQGQCTAADLPDDANALVLNVTALGATSQTFLTFWPAGDQPEAASLNPSPGAPPIPNAVTTQLDDDGNFRVFNERGSVNVVIDVSGYYADHNHDDRYPLKTDVYTKSEVYTRAESDARYYDRATVNGLIAIGALESGTISVPAQEFRHRVSGAGWQMQGGAIYVPSGEPNAVLEAPVLLPEGTNLGQLRASILDDVSGKDLHVELVRYADDGTRTILALAASVATGGFAFDEWISKSLIDEQVDNDAYTYVIEASPRLTTNSAVTTWPDFSMQLLKVEIQYAD
ncbi:MAG: hypothetical protein ACE37B_08095 [Ilumatobacter sp.]|uniref:hypothetical protein n=1 Tax=Ilumatobacter sp. TaxID=1967498 RepID=UPI00391B189B